MQSPIPLLALALTLSFGAAPVAAGPADEPEKLIASPGGADGADSYWSAERMERATVVRPITLDPETMQPVRSMS